MFSSLTELTLDIWVLKGVHMKSLNHFTHSINDGVPGSVLKLQRLKNNSQSLTLYFSDCDLTQLYLGGQNLPSCRSYVPSCCAL